MLRSGEKSGEVRSVAMNDAAAVVARSLHRRTATVRQASGTLTKFQTHVWQVVSYLVKNGSKVGVLPYLGMIAHAPTRNGLAENPDRKRQDRLRLLPYKPSRLQTKTRNFKNFMAGFWLVFWVQCSKTCFGCIFCCGAVELMVL